MNYSSMRLGLVGSFSGTHVAGSLARAATRIGISIREFDVAAANLGPSVLRVALWHFGDRRPIALQRFGQNVADACERDAIDIIIATGLAPLSSAALLKIRSAGAICVNYLTDDPWNRTQRAVWQFKAIPHYDVVFSPRGANIGDLKRLGCRDVRHLPFAYDEDLFATPSPSVSNAALDLLYVGGADADRVAFMRTFVAAGGPAPTLVGGYWNRFQIAGAKVLGLQPPQTLVELTASARVNLCLVRRANRDDHVMRSFEIPAAGGCVLAEDTAGHRTIFGPEGEAALYFSTPQEAARKANLLLADPATRLRLAAAANKRIIAGKNSYRDRLGSMLAVASALLGSSKIKERVRAP